MTIQSRNYHLTLESNSRHESDRQAKAVRVQSMLSVGLRRFRSLSGLSQKRSHEERPPLPSNAPISSSDRNLPSLAPISSPQLQQEVNSLSTGPSSSSPYDSNESDPLPCVSRLQGIHFVADATQDPYVDADESILTSASNSTQSEKSSLSGPEDTIDLLSCDTHSFSVTLSDQCVSPSPVSATPSDDSSSMSDLSVMSRILEKIPPKLLSTRVCHTASTPINAESPYAPYAPTSPLSASPRSDSQLPSQHATTLPFNIRAALRSKTPKATAKITPPQQRQTSNHQEITCQSNGLECLSSSSCKASSQTTFITTDSSSLVFSGCEPSLDECAPNLASNFSGTAVPNTYTSACATPQLGFQDQTGRQRRHSTSAGASSSIPFPGSSHTQEAIAANNERNRSQSSIFYLRNQLNNFWSLPINRLRTSSSLSTVIQGMRSGKRRPPSDASFEPRPFSMRTESSYEILDASAISPN